MKKLRKGLTLLMALCMALSIAPFGALAEGSEGGWSAPAETEAPAETPAETPATTPAETPAPTPADEIIFEEVAGQEQLTGVAATVTETYATGAGFCRILHLDCGRKYFSVDWVKALIKEMQAAGYTHLQLAIGNDGLRLLLDNMSVTANGTTYSSDDVKAGIQSGNVAYYNAGSKNEWTEAEMDEIFAAAEAAGISIIPLINTPGHMDAIVSCMNSLGVSGSNYNGSVRSFDITSSTAQGFVKALLQKYVAYFAGKGCTYFNIGADEFANDIYSGGSMGFGQLVSTGQYGTFIIYVNSLNALVKAAGMKTVAFNDGFYFNGNTTSGTLDTDITVSFWTSGWSGYQSASASELAAMGHPMTNTHGDYYYVVGKNDKWDSNSYTAASAFSNTAFMSSTISNPVGSTFCIWCDYPNAETEQEVAQKTRLVLRAMAARMQDKDVSTISTDVIEGGFNADGTINVPAVPDATVYSDTGTTTPDDTPNDAITVTAPGLVTLTCTQVETPREIEGAVAGRVVAYNLTPETASGAYTGAGTVAIPVPADWDAAKVKAFVVNSDNAITTVIGTHDAATNKYIFTAPHFSEMGLYEADPAAVVPDETITLEVGGTATRTQKNVNNSDNVDRTNLDESIATVVVTGTDAIEGGTTTAVEYVRAENVSCNALISSNSTSWVLAEGYYYTPDGGANYYPVYAKRSRNNNRYTYTWGYKAGDAEPVQIGTQLSRNTNATLNITVYTQSTSTETIPATPASTNITFTGVYPGTTYVTVGETVYEIVVNYKQESVMLPLTLVEGRTFTQSREIVAADVTNTKPEVATVAVNGSTVTIIPVAIGTATITAGDTIYAVTVAEEDLTQVTPLTVEYWITNGRPTVSASDSANSITAKADDTGIHSEAGVAIVGLVSPTTVKEGRTLEYWQSKIMDVSKENSSTSGTELQTVKNGDDETLNGAAFTKVRYWNGAWQVYTTEWITVDRTETTVTYTDGSDTVTYTGDKNQLIAYYMEVVNIDNENGESELHVNAADWGTKGDGSGDWGYPPESNRCSVSIQLVYEDGSLNPVDTTAESLKSKTIVYGYWDGGRGLGTMVFTGQQNYQIYKVTAETGDMTSTAASGNTVTVNSFTWDENEETVWEGDPTDSVGIGNAARNPSYTAPLDNLAWNTGDYNQNNAILIRVYVRAKATEDSLTVHYIDRSDNNTEFYNYNIAVKSGVVFNEGFALQNGSLVNNTVQNSLGITQTVTADLRTLSEIGAQYRYSNYTCVEVTRSVDGKEVFLYYTFSYDQSYMLDFGLPVEIPVSDFVIDMSQVQSIEIVGGSIGKYGASTISNNIITYTPAQTLPKSGEMPVKVTFADNTNTTYTVGLIPATTVYYEEGFATLAGFTGGSKGSGTQATEQAGSKIYNYGYDGKYSGEPNGPSNSTEAVSTALGSTAELTFTGTGIDVYANCTPTTGAVMLRLSKDGSLVKLITVDTKMANGTTDATSGQTVAAYNVPIATISGLTRGTYTLKVTHMKAGSDQANRTDGVKLDGFRVHGTLATDHAAYQSDGEADPTFVELRNKVLAALNVSTAGSQYANQIAANILSQVYENGTTNDGEGAVVMSNTAQYTTENMQDLLDNGPKNELYLYSGQTVVFTLTQDAQIGLKALNAATKYTINGGGENNLTTSTDMFYPVSSGTVSITNNGAGILAITRIKVCGGTAAANTFAALTTENLTPVLLRMGYLADGPEVVEPTPVPTAEPAEPTPEATVKPTPTPTAEPAEPTPEATVKPTIAPTDEPAEPTPAPTLKPTDKADAVLTVNVACGETVAAATLQANGNRGESHTFTAAEIQTAVETIALPNGYHLGSVAFSDITVNYGEARAVSITAEKEVEPTPQPTPEPTPTPEPEGSGSIFDAIRDFFQRIFGRKRS